MKRFKANRRYRMMGGGFVTVLACENGPRGYETIRCSDSSANAPEGIHRYNRSTHGADQGRVTGTAHDFSDPRNIDPFADRPALNIG